MSKPFQVVMTCIEVIFYGCSA